MPNPPQVPVISLVSPEIQDRLVHEIHDNNTARYRPLPYGSPHPNSREFPNHYLVLQKTTEDFRWTVQTFVTDRVNQNFFNASISYSGEGNAYPIFTRDYLLRRSVYQGTAPPAKGSALAGLVNLRVTAGGGGYADAGTLVTFSGGTGSGGAAEAIVYRGVVVGLLLTAEGNYTVAPTIAITGSGAGATATAAVQPATAVLAKEDEVRQPDQPTDSIFVLVRRVYETLPGPPLTGQEWNRREQLRIPFTKQITAAGAYVGEDNVQIEPINSVKQETTTWNDAAVQAQLDTYLRMTPAIVSRLQLPDVLVSLTAIFNVSSGEGESETEPAGASAGTSWALSLDDRSHSQGSAAILPDLIPERKVWTPKPLPGINCVIFVPDNSLLSEIYAHLASLLGRTVSSIVSGLATTLAADSGIAGHKLSVGQIFQFTSVVGGSGTGTTINTNYYVKTVPSPTTFTYSATLGGSATTGNAASAISIVPVNPIPIWRDEPVTINATGQHASVSADAGAQQHVSQSGENTTLTYSTSTGTSKEVGVSTRTWQLPPSLHAAVAIKDTDGNPIDNTISETAAAHAGAGWGAGTNWPARASGAVAPTGVVTSIFTPLVLDATDPTDWPTQGLYVNELVPEVYGYDRTMVMLQLVDFAVINPP